MRLMVSWTTPNTFDVLDVRALHGRTFGPADGGPGSEPVVVLSHGLWATRFGGDEGIIGRTLRLDGTEHTILGSDTLYDEEVDTSETGDYTLRGQVTWPNYWQTVVSGTFNVETNDARLTRGGPSISAAFPWCRAFLRAGRPWLRRPPSPVSEGQCHGDDRAPNI